MLNPDRFALAALSVLANIVAAGTASAQNWPTRPVTMVVPFAAGSSSDTAGRILAIGLSEALGQQVIIENVGGGGGMTGTARVAKAAPDGYQFVFASVDSMAIVPTMHKQPLYNSVTDFTAGGLVVEVVDKAGHGRRSYPWPRLKRLYESGGPRRGIGVAATSDVVVSP